ncbi:MAG: hypothetical protein AAB551_03355 [Patescibacteria group bacterium]
MLPQFDLTGLIQDNLALSEEEKKYYISFAELLDEEQRFDLFLLLSRHQEKALLIEKNAQQQIDQECATFLRSFERDSKKILQSSLDDFRKNEQHSAEESLSHNLQNL